MQRDLDVLTQTEYDLVIIGGGIHGACIAWDAALRGFQVALAEQDDFGHATSANSLKTLHGGLRYLQDGNLGLMRTMIRERRTWQRIAPHLVQPLPCLMPTSSRLARSRAVLGVALTLNDLLSADRNRGLLPVQYIPSSRILSRDECLTLLPGLDPTGVTGAARWYDAQMINSERLLLAVIRSAAEAGTTVANYVKVTGLQQTKKRVTGLFAQDTMTGEALPIRARLVVNATGGWTDTILNMMTGITMQPRFPQSIAMNLVTRQIEPHYAFGVASQVGSHRGPTFFIAPWQGYSLIGTLHHPYTGNPDEFSIDQAIVQDFLQQVNAAYPGGALTLDDVVHVQWGFLPQARTTGQAATNSAVNLLREGQIYDHAQTDGVQGLISVVGVKYTTARHVAARTVDLAVRRLGRTVAPCQTATTPLYGSDMATAETRRPTNQASRYNLADTVWAHLDQSYGNQYHSVLHCIDENPAWAAPVMSDQPILQAEVIHAVRHEMARHLTDVLQRRTPLGAAGCPATGAITLCAKLMATELDWDQPRVSSEIEQVYQTYAALWPLTSRRSWSELSSSIDTI